jgi:alpha-beta hydrolase superfamily lysophospholipase
MDTQRTVYYLPGHGGRLHTGLGEALMSRGLNLAGRETVDDFRRLRFMDQVQTVAEDLRTHFWRADAQVVANSFGAYLFLNAQSVLPPYPGKVLLLSPIVGAFDHPDKPMSFSPPMPTRLMDMATSGELSCPSQAEIHVGSQDWQANPEQVARLGELMRIPVHIVEGNGHMLDHGYVNGLLERWLVAASN